MHECGSNISSCFGETEEVGGKLMSDQGDKEKEKKGAKFSLTNFEGLMQ